MIHDAPSRVFVDAHEVEDSKSANMAFRDWLEIRASHYRLIMDWLGPS